MQLVKIMVSRGPGLKQAARGTALTRPRPLGRSGRKLWEARMAQGAEVPEFEPIAVIGLGYVGLPVAAAFARHFNVIGYDADPERVAALAAGPMSRCVNLNHARAKASANWSGFS